MCSVGTNGERASPAQGLAVIFLTTFIKHASILVKPLPEYQELVHISVHISVHIVYLYRLALAHRLLVDRYPQILHIYTRVNNYMLYTLAKIILKINKQISQNLSKTRY